jgi:hypothetical protein
MEGENEKLGKIETKNLQQKQAQFSDLFQLSVAHISFFVVLLKIVCQA